MARISARRLFDLRITKLFRSEKRRSFKRSGKSLIVIASMPKSASQHFLHIFGTVYSDAYSVIRGKMSSGSGHNFLSSDRITQELPPKTNAALYGHFPLTTYNERVLSGFTKCRKAIVTVRNLLDTIYSYKDHVDRHGLGPLDPRIESLAEGSAHWQHFNDEQKCAFLVAFVSPWYVRFLSSWIAASRRGWTVLFSPFEEHTSAPLQAIRAVGQGLQLDDAPEHKIGHGQLNKKTNFNMGIGGRGLAGLTPALKQRIREQFELSLDSNDSLLVRYLLDGYDAVGFSPQSAPLIRAQGLPSPENILLRPYEPAIRVLNAGPRIKAVPGLRRAA